MLFYQKYIPHEVEKLHELLVFFFDKVEKENPITFDVKKLFPLWYSDNKTRLLDLEKKLTTFLKFPDDIKREVAIAFREATEIESFFSDITKDIPTARNFSDEKKYFWKKETETKNGKAKEIIFTMQHFLVELFVPLYENQLGKKDSTFSEKIGGNLNDHYTKFLHENRIDYSKNQICPICGLEPMKDAKNIGRPDYDHLLPKGDGLFVFSAVNLKNLFPIGDDCNNKKSSLPLLYSDNSLINRTIAFYPYSNLPHPYEQYEITLFCNEEPHKSNLYEGKWGVEIRPNNPDDKKTLDKISSWNNVFKIKERLAQRVADRNKAWLGREFQSIENETMLIEKIRIQFDRLPCNHLFLTTYEGLIPERIFLGWILKERTYLSNLVKVKTPTNINVSTSDYEN